MEFFFFFFKITFLLFFFYSLYGLSIKYFQRHKSLFVSAYLKKISALLGAVCVHLCMCGVANHLI